MKKILFLVRLPPPVHGAAKMNELYLNSKVINNSFNVDYIKLNNYKTLNQNIYNKCLSIIGFFKVLFLLFYRLLFFRPKLIYFEMAPKGLALFRDSFYILICKLFNKKVVCHFHAKGMNDYLYNKPFLIKYYKFVFKNVNCILLSPILYKDYSIIISKKQVHYLPNGIKDEINDKEFKQIIFNRLKNKELNLLFLSNMIESKGPLDVLKICNLLKKDKVNFKCYFAGAWDSKDFEKKWFSYLKKHNLDKNCFYLGPKYGSEKIKLLSKTNYLIHPTTNDCFPLVILESFMVGVPVLTYNEGAVTDIINNEKLGFVSNNSNYLDLYKHLKQTYKNKIDYNYIRNNFKKRYILSVAENNLYKLFKKVV